MWGMKYSGCSRKTARGLHEAELKKTRVVISLKAKHDMTAAPFS